MQTLFFSCALSCLFLFSIPASAQKRLCTELERTKLLDDITQNINYILLQKSGYKKNVSYNKEYRASQITFYNGPNSFIFLKFRYKYILAVVNTIKPEPLLSSIIQVGNTKTDALKKVGVKKTHDCLKLYDDTGFLNADILFRGGYVYKILFYSTID